MRTDGYLTLTEAGVLLGVSKNKMWRLVKEGVLAATENPLDKREKLVRRQDVERLRQYAKVVSEQTPPLQRKTVNRRSR